MSLNEKMPEIEETYPRTEYANSEEFKALEATINESPKAVRERRLPVKQVPEWLTSSRQITAIKQRKGV